MKKIIITGTLYNAKACDALVKIYQDYANPIAATHFYASFSAEFQVPDAGTYSLYIHFVTGGKMEFTVSGDIKPVDAADLKKINDNTHGNIQIETTN